MTGLDLLQQRLEAGPVKVRPGVAVIREMAEISQSVLPGVVFEILLLVGDTVGFALKLIVSGQTFIQGGDLCLDLLSHGSGLLSHVINRKPQS